MIDLFVVLALYRLETFHIKNRKVYSDAKNFIGLWSVRCLVSELDNTNESFCNLVFKSFRISHLIVLPLNYINATCKVQRFDRGSDLRTCLTCVLV